MTIEGMELRRIFGLFPTGVVIVSAETAAGERLGMTMSSYNTVSLDPPLILFSIQRNAFSFTAWQSADRYAVSILRSNQENLANRFARAKGEKWEGVETEGGGSEAPVPAGCLVTMQCLPHARFDGGDHEIFVGRVVSVKNNAGPYSVPLVFFAGKFRSLASDVAHFPAEDAVYLHGW